MSQFSSFKGLVKSLAKLPKKQKPTCLMVGFLQAKAGPHDHVEAIQVESADGEFGNLVPVDFAAIPFGAALDLTAILEKQPPLAIDWTYFYVIGAIPKSPPTRDTVQEIVLQQLDRAADTDFDPDSGIALFDRNGLRVTAIEWPKSVVH